MREALIASAVLMNRDPYCGDYIAKFKAYTPSSTTTSPTPRETRATTPGEEPLVSSPLPADRLPVEDRPAELKRQIRQTIIDGNRNHIQELLQEALEAGLEPLVLVNEAMIPGIEEVGQRYEDKSFFLPQLILGAETMKAGFAIMRPRLSSGPGQSVGKIVLATVQGDIHDIGKNIVAVMMENYGFQVIDLGKDVPTQTIIETALQEKADLIGLSALMTTTMPRMAEVVAEIQKRGMKTRVLIGGAVVTQDYADKIGADAYAPDARAGVLRALELVGARVGYGTST